MKAILDNYSPPIVHVWGDGKDQEAKEKVVCRVMGQRLGLQFDSYQQYRSLLNSILKKGTKGE